MFKKFLLAVLALSLTLISPQGVKAEEITSGDTESSGSISVSYNANVNYKVTIPASVTFTDSEKTVERALMASDVLLNKGGKLGISVSSLNGFKMVNDSGYIEYGMKVNGHDIDTQEDIVILTVLAGETSGWATLDFETTLSGEHAEYAGNYSDTLTFTVQVTG